MKIPTENNWLRETWKPLSFSFVYNLNWNILIVEMCFQQDKFEFWVILSIKDYAKSQKKYS